MSSILHTGEKCLVNYSLNVSSVSSSSHGILLITFFYRRLKHWQVVIINLLFCATTETLHLQYT